MKEVEICEQNCILASIYLLKKWWITIGLPARMMIAKMVK